MCQRKTCSGARTRKISPHVNHVKILPFLRSRALDLRVQKQLYLRNGTGYLHQILDEHEERINKAESSEISKKIFTNLYYICMHSHICGRFFSLSWSLPVMEADNGVGEGDKKMEDEADGHLERDVKKPRTGPTLF